MNKPSRPFSNGMEYEFWKECFCGRCDKFKLDKSGMPLPDNCEIENALAMARFDEQEWPAEQIVETPDRHKVCTKFCCKDQNLMESYRKLLERSKPDIAD